MSKTQYDSSGFIIFVTTFVGSLLFFGYISFFAPGVDLKENVMDPASIEVSGDQKLAEQDDFDPEEVEELWVSSPGFVKHGAKMFKNNCAVCHGVTGKGDGPASAGINVRNLVKGGWQQGGTSAELYQTLIDGVNGTSMASFKDALPQKVDRWALVHFIRSITQDKPEDDVESLKAYAQSAE